MNLEETEKKTKRNSYVDASTSLRLPVFPFLINHSKLHQLLCLYVIRTTHCYKRVFCILLSSQNLSLVRLSDIGSIL